MRRTHYILPLAFMFLLLFSMTGIHHRLSTPSPLLAQTNFATTITVTSTDDSDVSKSHTCYTTPGVGQEAFPEQCTLRRAIVEASSLPDSARPVLINFDIPQSDPGYQSQAQIWRIVLNTAAPAGEELPPIGSGQVTIDGTTQAGGRASGPNIFITANDLETAASPSLRLRLGETTSDDGYTVRGLGLQGFGISMTGSNNTVEQNWLGLTDDGSKVWFYRGENPRFVTRTRTSNDTYTTTPVANAAYFFEGDPEKGSGAEIVDAKAGSNNVIRDNVLAGTNGVAINISSSGSQVTNNLLGTRADGTIPEVAANRKCKPNALYYNWFSGAGINLSSDASDTTVQGNTIVGMLKYSKDVLNTPFDAITVRGSDNTIAENAIGVDANGNQVGVCGEGIDLGGKNQMVQNNTLVDTHGGAFGIYGTAAVLDSIHLEANTTERSYLGHSLTFPSNPFFGQSVPEVYKDFNSAAVTSLSGTSVAGTAGANSPCAGCTIELYADNTDQYIEALELLGTATAGADGSWSATLSRALSAGEGLRTASTTASNMQISGIDAPTTAKFSVLYGESGVITPEIRADDAAPITQPPQFPTLSPREAPALPTRTYATEITVNSTADSGPDKNTICTGNESCTLRYAINEVRKLQTESGVHPILIQFAIPEGDSGYDSSTGTWKITMSSNERMRVEGGQVTIDGTTQAGGRESGPKIIVTDKYDLVMDGGDNIVHGLNFQETGLIVNGSYNFVEGNWFGITADGQGIHYANGDPSRENHAYLQDGTESSVGTPAIANVYRNNVFAGSISPAITVRGNASWVVGNAIGTLADGTVPADLPADWCSTEAWYGGAGITVSGAGNQIGGPSDAERNYLVGLNFPISATALPPNAITLEGQGGNLVLNNVLGQDRQGTEAGNCGEGMRLSDDYAVVQDNVIIGHGSAAFHQVSPRLGGNSNLLTSNTLKGNATAMAYSDAVKSELDLSGFNPARVMAINGTSVRGISGNDFIDPITGYVVEGFCPYCTIEIFADNDDETPDALELLATTTAGPDGAWNATLSRSLAGGEGIRTTSTSGDYGYGIKQYEVNTTSKLSRLYTVLVNDGIVEATIDPAMTEAFTSYDDQVEVEVPSGATSSEVTMTYTDMDSPAHAAPSGSTVLRAFSLVAGGTGALTDTTTFQKEITIQLRYTDDELESLGITEGNLTARYWDTETTTWSEVTSTPTCSRCGVSVLEEKNLILVKVDHLTEFFVGTVGQGGGGGSSGLSVYLPRVMR